MPVEQYSGDGFQTQENGGGMGKKGIPPPQGVVNATSTPLSKFTRTMMPM